MKGEAASQAMKLMVKSARPKDRRSALLGRDRELDSLKDALHQAASGKGRIEAVCGEPGIGKTRLLEELSDYAASCGCLIYSACCLDDPGCPPYWPWSQILTSLVSGLKQSLLSDTFASGAALVAEAFPAIRAAIPSPPRPAFGSDTAESDRFRLFDAVTRLLAAQSRNETLVLLMDDLQWADELSLKLLVHVSTELAESRILLVGAYRDLGFEPGHPLPTAIGALAQKRSFSRVPLHGLSETDTAGLLAKGIDKTLARSLAEKVFHLTDGNPLFITQVIRLLVNEPGADAAPGGLAVSVKDIIARRLSHLSTACSEAVSVASILGSEFTGSLLAEVATRESGDELSAAMDEAVRERIIEQTGDAPGRYRFCHVLIRDAILSCIQPGRRAKLHARVFEILENRWKGDAPAHASELLVHAVQGQDVLGPETAARYAGFAGEAALHAHAYEDAQRHFAAGLAALQDRPMDELKALLTFGSARARSAWDMGHLTRGLFQQCFEYYEARDDTAKMLEVLSYRFVPPEPVLLPLYERALARVAPDSLERGRLLSWYGLIKAVKARKGARGAPELLEALRLARLHADLWLEMRVLWLTSFAGGARGGFNERYARLVEADELARRLGDCADEMWIRGSMLGELLNRGRLDEAADLAKRMSETAERQGDLLDRHHARSAELKVAWHKAEWGKVCSLCTEILEQSPPFFLGDGIHLLFRCEAAYHTGNVTAGRQDLLSLIEKARGTPRVPALIFLNCASAMTAVSKLTGDASLLDEAQGFVRLILEIPEISSFVDDYAHQILARICVLRRDATGAAAEYDKLTEQLARTPSEDRPFVRPTHDVLGALAALRGDLDRAVAHYENALLVAGYPLHERAWVEFSFSEVLTLRQARGDLERARSLLEACLKTAENAALVPLAKRAREALASMGSGGRKASLDGLTDRETEVLALIARGLTNKEIGAKLFISAKTVDAHVRNILEKTGTANRTEAAAYAIWHDLPGV